VAEHVGTADPAPLRLIGTEYGSEIAEPGRAEQRITQRMSSDVTIGMTGAAVSVSKQKTQQPARPPSLDGMYVGAKPDTHVRSPYRKP
jgi:hypothetical protein